MASAKTATLTFRIEPELKEAVRLASVNEYRTIANMVAVMIRKHCISSLFILGRSAQRGGQVAFILVDHVVEPLFIKNRKLIHYHFSFMRSPRPVN